MKNFKVQNRRIFVRSIFPAMIKWTCFSIVILISLASFAQRSPLIVEGTTPKLFIVHKVTPKENFYSIGRMYNLPAKDIAAYNNLQFENGLGVGESIKIPLSQNNFTQSEPAGTGEVLVPVYHTVQPKEGLYRVSLNYNKVPISSLKKWNHIQSDAVSIGSPLIVGYLKVSKGESALAGAGRTGIDMSVPSGDTKQGDTKTDKPANTKPHAQKLPPVNNPQTVKQENKNVPDTDDHKAAVTSVNTKSNINFSGGYFKKLYTEQTENKSPVNETGSAGVFKSTSGWQDGKYYCFNNNAAPGTVIKITDYLTGKSVYAKVLDAIPDIKQNADLTVILSNAAAEELGAAQGKFDCTLTYIK